MGSGKRRILEEPRVEPDRWHLRVCWLPVASFRLHGTSLDPRQLLHVARNPKHRKSSLGHVNSSILAPVDPSDSNRSTRRRNGRYPVLLDSSVGPTSGPYGLGRCSPADFLLSRSGVRKFNDHGELQPISKQHRQGRSNRFECQLLHECSWRLRHLLGHWIHVGWNWTTRVWSCKRGSWIGVCCLPRGRGSTPGIFDLGCGVFLDASFSRVG